MSLLAILLALALLHACYGAVLAALVRRLDAGHASWAWMPVANLVLPFVLAGRSPAWAALLLVPPLNVIAWVLVWAEVFARLGRPSWPALFTAVPGVNLLVLARAAGVRPARIAAASALVLASLVGAGAASRAGRPAAPAPLAPEALLRVVLQDADPAARAEAARALAGQGEPAVAVVPVEAMVAALLDGARGTGARDMPDVELVDALARQGHAAARALVAALRDADAGVRWHAAAALMHLGRQAAGSAAALRVAMDDPEWIVRNAAGRALEEVCGADDVPALVRALADPSVETRYHAARALARQGEDAAPAVAALEVALRDEDWEVRTEAVRALSNAGGAARAALPGLTSVLAGDADPQVREAAAWALGALEPTPAATGALQRALSDPAVAVRRAARSVLARHQRGG